MPRLFFALWPDETTRNALAEAAASLRLRDGRAVRPENLHLTLQFLGQVDEAAAKALCADPPRPAVAPFELQLGDAGWWRGSRVAWLAPLDTPPALERLAAGLGEALAARGFAIETQPFRAHVTVARQCRRAPRVTGGVDVRWKIAEFALVSSVTDPAGARYRVLETWPLQAPANGPSGR